MSIDEHATSDLSLDDESAESVLGGHKPKKPAHKAAPTYKVAYIETPGGSNPAAVDTESMDAAQDC